MHRKNKIVAVWQDKENPLKEDNSYYEMIYDGQVDMITTDFPHEAHKCLTEIHKKRRGLKK
jgi:glycerophosphoryl diester phosphodiesterase